jgi:putative flippase GtrA
MAGLLVESDRFIRFAVVGGAGAIVDIGLLAILHHGAGLDPFSARTVSIVSAAFATWRLNRALTFGASDAGQAAEGLRYALVAALAAALNYLLYALALTLWPELSPVAAVVAATLVAMLFSYLGYSRFVFSRAPTVVESSRLQRR